MTRSCLRFHPSQTPVAAILEPPKPRGLFPRRRVTGTTRNRPSREPALYIRRFRSSLPRAEIQQHRRTVPVWRIVVARSRQPEHSRTALAFAGAMTHIVRQRNSSVIRRTDRRQTARAHGVEYRTVSSCMPTFKKPNCQRSGRMHRVSAIGRIEPDELASARTCAAYHREAPTPPARDELSAESECSECSTQIQLSSLPRLSTELVTGPKSRALSRKKPGCSTRKRKLPHLRARTRSHRSYDHATRSKSASFRSL